MTNININNLLKCFYFVYRFAFRIYDIDNDGYISNGELFQVITDFLITCTTQTIMFTFVIPFATAITP